MKTASRFILERVVALDRAIRAGQYPNARTMADLLECDRRTIQRDIEFLQDRLKAPLAYDPRRHGYSYTDPDYRLSFLELTDDELVALLLAQGASAQLGAPFAAELARAVRKVAGSWAARAGGDLSATHSFRLSAPSPMESSLYRDLDAAIRGRNRLAIRYWSASRAEETERLVDPYHLASIDGYYYLVAHCHLRGEVRMFVPSRIRSLGPTGSTFPPPEGFRIDDYLALSFSVLPGGEGEVYRVLLRFTGEAVRYVRERTWHPSQTTEATPSGDLILGFEVSHLREVERFALSWGPDCEALEPPTLRHRLARSLSQAAARYLHPPGERDKHPDTIDECLEQGRPESPSR
jgi:predicted DNA-binding transcriptional regulator YafY